MCNWKAILAPCAPPVAVPAVEAWTPVPKELSAAAAAFERFTLNEAVFVETMSTCAPFCTAKMPASRSAESPLIAVARFAPAVAAVVSVATLNVLLTNAPFET